MRSGKLLQGSELSLWWRLPDSNLCGGAATKQFRDLSAAAFAGDLELDLSESESAELAESSRGAACL